MSKKNENETNISYSENDAIYKKNICKATGIKKISPNALNSIVGPDEFKDIISKNSERRNFYIAGERPEKSAGISDSNDIENVKMKIFGANLHIHSNHSDGALSVEEILDQAVSYANEYAKENDEKFVIGITDHNTSEGCKEAVKIIANNPEKYKNLKVVLGVEFSAKEDEINGYKLRKPEKYHILAMSINPFETKLENFLQDLISNSNNPMHPKAITVQDVFENVKHQENCHFALAHPAYPDITHRIYQDKDPYETTQETMKHFKDIVGSRGLYAECYYGGYSGKLATDEQLYKTIEKSCEQLGLYKAGGLDTHGESIFYSGANA